MIYNQVEKLNYSNSCLHVGEGEIIFLFIAFQSSIYYKVIKNNNS